MPVGEGEEVDTGAVEEEGAGHREGWFAGDISQAYQGAFRFIHHLASAGELQLGGDWGWNHTKRQQDPGEFEQDDDEPASALSCSLHDI